MESWLKNTRLLLIAAVGLAAASGCNDRDDDDWDAEGRPQVDEA